MNKELQCLENQRVGGKFVVGPYVTGGLYFLFSNNLFYLILLTKGSFGCIFLGTNTKTEQRVAIKMEKQDVDKPQLHLEYGFYRSLGVMRFLPKISYFGFCLNYNALVMELLGPSLNNMCTTCGGQFGIVTTTKVFIQLLNIFEYVHDYGIIYRDIKPDNFLFGQPETPKWSTVHLIGTSNFFFTKKLILFDFLDMGFCKRYLDEQNKHIKYKEGKCMTGTVRYISINNHLCRELSRRDDLEAIAYMIIFLHKGELPWQGVTADNIRDKYRQIG